MKAWTGQHAWKERSGRLAKAEGDDFAREALRLLRFLWPEMVEAPRMKSWDRRGIDLLVWADIPPFPCVVQCKGFAVQDVDADQIRNMEASIQSFLQSDTVAERYLLVHNRDHRNPEVLARIQPLLDEIVAKGKAQKAEIWMRQQMVTELFVAMEERIRRLLQERSRALLEHFGHLLRFGELHVERVPASSRELTFRRDAPCSVGPASPIAPTDITAAIAHSSGTRWTTLSGHFGTGKTANALRAAAEADRPVVLVPAATVPTKVFTDGNTNGLTQHIVSSLDLFADDEQQQELKAVAGAVLSYLMRHEESSLVFVLDGLDEHHIFANLDGLKKLANQLAEFKCSVVLTTRSEHLDGLLGEFNVAFSGLGSRFGRERLVNSVTLHHWRDAEVLDLVDRANRVARQDERPHLASLRADLSTGRAKGFYGDLLYHPLFLHFILEDVAEDGIHAHTRSTLLRKWIERKLRRDRTAWAPGTIESRVALDSSMETETLLYAMLLALEESAFGLAQSTSTGMVLLESADSQFFLEIMTRHFTAGGMALLPVLLNSVLIIHSREQGSIRVGFALRALQEYLVAAYLVRHGRTTDGWPESVRDFAQDLTNNKTAIL